MSSPNTIVTTTTPMICSTGAAVLEGGRQRHRSAPDYCRLTAISKGLPSISARAAPAVRAVVDDRGGERLAGHVVLVGARGGEQLLVAAERQRDPVLDLQAGVLARGLDGVHDLAGEPLAAQLVVELEVERHGVRARALDLVALERLQHHLDVVGAERVLLAVDADADAAAVAQRRAARSASSAATAAATCGICLPKRGPSVR